MALVTSSTWIPWAIVTVLVALVTVRVWIHVRHSNRSSVPELTFETYHLVGRTVEDAREILLQTHPDLFVEPACQGTRKDGTRSDRVRLVFDHTGTVVETPVIG